jgi:hypothetical protein
MISKMHSRLTIRLKIKKSREREYEALGEKNSNFGEGKYSSERNL